MKYYLIGIKGSGMSTLAQILFDLGYEVSGYDDNLDYKFTEEGLVKRHIPIYHDGQNNLSSDTIVTYSAAFKETHLEIQRAKSLGLKIQKYHEILGDLTKKFNSICVCGTHGKTTTSTLITHVLKNTVGCNYFIGDGTGHASLDNNLFVIESCEFNRHFLSYEPTYTVLTNIELEHTETYKSLEDIISTFQTFASKTKKKIIACGDDENIRKLKLTQEVIYYGLNDNNDVVAKNIDYSSKNTTFDCYIKNEFMGRITISLYGKHMVLNTLACIAMLTELNIPFANITTLLKTFQNAKRRFHEEQVKDTIIIDDYAHHPTEIAATISTARQKYPDKTVVAVFKPNTYSRTKDFYHDYATQLSKADITYLTEIESNRETALEYPGVTSKLIFDELTNGHMLTDDNINDLTKIPNAVILFLSCASVSHLIEKFHQLKK